MHAKTKSLLIKFSYLKIQTMLMKIKYFLPPIPAHALSTSQNIHIDEYTKSMLSVEDNPKVLGQLKRLGWRIYITSSQT